ncbi:MAG: hypothetical protein FJW78_06390, partial [Actinobacteria bacterium]|nr:hypothetical protein [Actinomycetota bacterium]
MRTTAFSPDGYVAAALTVEGQGLLAEKVGGLVRDELLPADRADSLAERVVAPLPISDPEKSLLAAAIGSTVRNQVANAVQSYLNSGAGQQVAEALSGRLSEEIVKLVDDGTGV